MSYSKENLLFVPLGGAGEIGMNCNLYHFNDQWIMVDLGVTFSDDSSNLYELIMPDLGFILDRIDKLSAIILTHAHEDHIGAVPYFFEKIRKTPIYTTPFTASVLKRKFESQGISNYEINILEYGKSLKIGSFDIEIYCLTHSIPEPNAVLLKTKKGNIFHTGDWKIDPQPLVGKPIEHKNLQKFVKDGIDVMVCDSTNVFDPKPSGSEGEVRENLKKIIMADRNGKIIITCFASNIARIESILKISSLANKCCLLLGRSLQRIYESAKENNYLLECKNIVTEKEAKIISEKDLVVICTGSQGETRAALSRLVNGKHKYLKLSKNDAVIFSSREIPGNEKRINEVKTAVMKSNCKIFDHTNSKVHVSGHPSKEELEKMYKWISPDLLIPVHGEYKHLDEQVKFSKKCGIKKQILVENGDLVKLDKKSDKKIISKVLFGRTALKGNKIVPINDRFFNELNQISSNGEIFINIIMNLNDEIIADPVIFCPSLLIDDLDKDQIRDIIKIGIESFSANSIDDKNLCNQLRLEIRSYIKNKIGLKPSTYVEIVRI